MGSSSSTQVGTSRVDGFVRPARRTQDQGQVLRDVRRVDQAFDSASAALDAALDEWANLSRCLRSGVVEDRPSGWSDEQILAGLRRLSGRTAVAREQLDAIARLSALVGLSLGWCLPAEMACASDAEEPAWMERAS